jgi:hypothetical protein
MSHKVTNHDILVALILERLGSLPQLKKDILSRTNRKYVTRMTIQRAFHTASRYVLADGVYLPTIQVGHREDRPETTIVTTLPPIITISNSSEDVLTKLEGLSIKPQEDI